VVDEPAMDWAKDLPFDVPVVVTASAVTAPSVSGATAPACVVQHTVDMLGHGSGTRPMRAS